MTPLSNKTIKAINMAISGHPKISAALRTHTSLDGLLTAIHAAHHELDDSFNATAGVNMRRYFIIRYTRDIEKYVMSMLLENPAELGDYDSVYLNSYRDQINARLGLMGKPKLAVSSNCTGTPVRFEWSRMSVEEFNKRQRLNDLLDNKDRFNALANQRGMSKTAMQESFYKRMINEKVAQDAFNQFNATSAITTGATVDSSDMNYDAVAALIETLKAK